MLTGRLNVPAATHADDTLANSKVCSVLELWANSYVVIQSRSVAWNFYDRLQYYSFSDTIESNEDGIKNKHTYHSGHRELLYFESTCYEAVFCFLKIIIAKWRSRLLQDASMHSQLHIDR